MDAISSDRRRSLGSPAIRIESADALASKVFIGSILSLEVAASITIRARTRRAPTVSKGFVAASANLLECRGGPGGRPSVKPPRGLTTAAKGTHKACPYGIQGVRCSLHEPAGM